MEQTPCGRKVDELMLPMCEYHGCNRMNECRVYWDFRNRVIARDKVCQDCGATENLEVHHIVRRKVDPGLALSPNNCILLCRSCHQRRHEEAQAWHDDSPIWEDSPYYDDEWVLCSECGVNYHPGRFKMCYSCWKEAHP